MEVAFVTAHPVMITTGKDRAAIPDLGQERTTVETNMAVAFEGSVDITAQGLHRPYVPDCNFKSKRQG